LPVEAWTRFHQTPGGNAVGGAFLLALGCLIVAVIGAALVVDGADDPRSAPFNSRDFY
jgi:hypothetical protein